ncbi:DUF45 domain-containing protein [Tardisphaera miroshnichenkoae]
MKRVKRALLASGTFTPTGSNVSLPYEVYSGRSKLAYIRVTSSKITLVIPRGLSVDPVVLLREKSQWIARAYARALSVLRVVDGNRFLLRGEYHNFDELKGSSLSALYKRETEAYVKERVTYYKGIMGFRYRSLTVKPSRAWWGRCSGRGDLAYNSQLAALPDKLRDYVVLHEIVHLYEHNHSAAFKARLKSIMPDYADRENELKNYAPVLLG